MNRIIFLDVDGVLATRPMVARPAARSFSIPRGVGAAGARPLAPKPPRILRAQAITFLNQICAETGAHLVVSSSWRLKGDPRATLANAGVAGRFHADWATDSDGPQRGDEITRWLAAHGQPSYVVLDDWRDGLELHAARLVQTDFRFGLSAKDAQAANRLFQHAPGLAGESCGAWPLGR